MDDHPADPGARGRVVDDRHRDRHQLPGADAGGEDVDALDVRRRRGRRRRRGGGPGRATAAMGWPRRCRSPRRAARRGRRGAVVASAHGMARQPGTAAGRTGRWQNRRSRHEGVPRCHSPQSTTRCARRSGTSSPASCAPTRTSGRRPSTSPTAVFPRMGELGLLGLRYPEEYGGQGGDYWSAIVLAEEMARCGSGGRGHGGLRPGRDGHAADLQVRHRGAEAALPGAGHPRPEGGRAGHHRAGHRQRRRLGPHPRGAAQRRLAHQRQQALHHQRGALRLHPAGGPHRHAGRGRARHHPLPRRQGHARASR